MDSLLVGSSPFMRELREQLLEVAPYDVPVSLRGESGTGKGSGRPIGEHVLRDTQIGFTAATISAPVGAAAGRVAAAVEAGESAAATGTYGSVQVASTLEANAAARIWAGLGAGTIMQNRAGATFGQVVGRILADATRVARFAASKPNGTVAANLEDLLTGSNMHVVVKP